jgi:hypothetical protein
MLKKQLAATFCEHILSEVYNGECLLHRSLQGWNYFLIDRKSKMDVTGDKIAYDQMGKMFSK